VALHIVYRAHGGENNKDRPPHYDKMLCLASLLRAAERVDATVDFLNDGPMPRRFLDVMESAGSITELPGVGMRGSYRAALEHATSGRWADEDIVWFSEDDYLYRPDSFEQLERATTAIPEADYFALYGLRYDEVEHYRGWQELPPWSAAGQQWSRIYSTTSSFGARIGALGDDMGIFRLCMLPHKKQLRDHDTCLVLQGAEPHRYGDLARAAVGLSGDTVRERLRGAALAPFLLATNLRAHRRAERRRVFVAADPNLATHMEEGFLAPGMDWGAVAEDTRRWAAGRGIASGDGAIISDR
jgi:hypothetical protein